MARVGNATEARSIVSTMLPGRGSSRNETCPYDARGGRAVPGRPGGRGGARPGDERVVNQAEYLKYGLGRVTVYEDGLQPSR